MEEEGYVWQEKICLTKVKIPAGCVKCPTCEGRGKVRLIWGPAYMPGQFGQCYTCLGKGYEAKSLLEQMGLLDSTIVTESIGGEKK